MSNNTTYLLVFAKLFAGKAPRQICKALETPNLNQRHALNKALRDKRTSPPTMRMNIGCTSAAQARYIRQLWTEQFAHKIDDNIGPTAVASIHLQDTAGRVFYIRLRMTELVRLWRKMLAHMHQCTHTLQQAAQAWITCASSLCSTRRDIEGIPRSRL